MSLTPAPIPGFIVDQGRLKLGGCIMECPHLVLLLIPTTQESTFLHASFLWLHYHIVLMMVDGTSYYPSNLSNL